MNEQRFLLTTPHDLPPSEDQPPSKQGQTLKRSLLAVLAALIALLAVNNPSARAQQLVAQGEEEDPNAPKGFSLKKEQSAVTNALEDFDRYVEKKEWEKAFRAVTTVADAQANGMVSFDDGLLIPTRQRLLRSLLKLPSEGKQAFRLFFDPKAKQEFEAFRAKEAEAGVTGPAALQKIVESYFVTDAGDQAADYLANLYFQDGEFTAAAGLWKMILDNYPDTDLSALRLEIKRATALARAGQWDDYDDILTKVKERHAGQSVTIAGQEQDAAKYLESLAADRDTQLSSDALASQSPLSDTKLRLPEGGQPLWQMPFGDDTLREQVAQLMAQGWWIQTDVSNSIPVSAVDDKRLYVNWLGVCFALDIKTGKLLWRTDKFTDLAGKAQQIVQSDVALERYMITPAGSDRVLYTRIPLDRLNYHQEPYRLICVDAQTGDIKWNSEKITGLENMNFIGKPTLMEDGRTLYAFSTPRGGGELSILELDLETGKLGWSLALGTPQAGTNRRGSPEVPIPSVMSYEGLLYVMTNNGAVICLRPDARRIEWAATYTPAPPMAEQQTFWINGMMMGNQQIDTPGVAIRQGGTLFIKEARSNRLYALDLVEKSMRWKRPVEPADMLVGIGDAIYVVGNEISAIDRETRAMKWSTALPVMTGEMRPIIAGDRAYVLTNRGLFEIDTSNGDVTHIMRSADPEAIGGALWHVGNKLITVSNSAVTAYPLTDADATKTAAK